MNHQVEIIRAKNYISEQGYGTGTTFTLNVVASLMVEWHNKKLSQPQPEIPETNEAMQNLANHYGLEETK